MTITVNNKTIEISEESNIVDLLTTLSINPDEVIVLHNDSIVKKGALREIKIEDKDNIELIKFVGGG
ncbi:MAG TPA: sulfur carrier protein ThiS [Spirochaetota bacterium]|nr:sulfur carrier protein ThiS [Spirochaetota bacterium]HOS32148.1 sulfur carrier protein ThiS [Spirochaetota bacterium]HOS54576.1 sulfur carrier protein ThiS [Spirochaetota bacterium]HPK60889.1 sulfur carrier protein ThiS [Spirochaetota bacterium]HQF77074.1 sulfur carrier protein ThiS [Spirochaetota bacterium]